MVGHLQPPDHARRQARQLQRVLECLGRGEQRHRREERRRVVEVFTLRETTLVSGRDESDASDADSKVPAGERRTM